MSTEASEQGLHAAARAGNLQKVKDFLGESASGVDRKDKTGKTALFYAVEAGHHELVAFLLQKGAVVCPLSSRCTTPLEIAVENGDTAVVKALLEHHKTPSLKTYLSASYVHDTHALRIAVKSRHAEIVKLLLDAGANANADAGWMRGKPLHIAVSRNAFSREAMPPVDTTVIQHLLRAGADITAHLDYRTDPTVIHIATQHHQHEVLEVIWQQGANLDVPDDCGRTALHYAANAFECADFHQKKALLTDHDPINQTLATLIRLGADVNAVDDRGWTPLHYAAKHGNHEGIRLLVEAGASLSVVNLQGETPRMVGLAHKHVICSSSSEEIPSRLSAWFSTVKKVWFGKRAPTPYEKVPQTLSIHGSECIGLVDAEAGGFATGSFEKVDSLDPDYLLGDIKEDGEPSFDIHQDEIGNFDVLLENTDSGSPTI